MPKKDVVFSDKRTAFNLMFKPIGPVCNLNCKYCYYLEKENLFERKNDFKAAIKAYKRAGIFCL